ncbi:MAG: glycosyltransferase family 4 protein [Planctomycetes bacterium]|nr:glycosyltransferase family 4 protein [Planctomycetota bacterium]
MPIRVLHIIGSLRLGGAQMCLKNIVEHASKDKVEHFIYPLRSKQIDIPIDGNMIKFPYPNYDPRKFLAILRICRQYDIDIIHAHLEKPVIGALVANIFCRVPVIVHEHGPIFRKSFKYSLYRIALRLLRSRASQFIAVSQATAAELTAKANISEKNITVVYNSVDTAMFKPDDDLRRKYRQELNISEDQTVIGFMGRLAHVKGVDLLLEAIALLLGPNPEMLLILVGDGPELDSLMSQAKRLGISDNVIFLGFRDDISQIINAFDISVIPSRQEPLGIVALELMAAKVPIVCSGVEGLAEIIIDNRTGLVTEQNTPEQIAACIQKLLHDKDLCMRLVEHAADFVTRFDVHCQVDAIEEIYVDLYSNAQNQESRQF